MELKLKSNTTHIEIISKLLYARTQAHILHFQSKKYSEHVALGEFYEKLTELVDMYVECVQGKLGEILTGYKSFPIAENISSLQFLTQLKSDVENYRINTLNKKEFNNLDNQMQVIVDNIEQTIYKLKFLA